MIVFRSRHLVINGGKNHFSEVKHCHERLAFFKNYFYFCWFFLNVRATQLQIQRIIFFATNIVISQYMTYSKYYRILFEFMLSLGV